MVDFFGSNVDSLRHFIYLMSFHLPRCLIFIFFFPLFGKGFGQGGFIKIAVCGAILLAPVSTYMGVYERTPLIPALTVITALSEVFIGTLLGLTMAIPYYVFKAYGAFVDVFRGATFAASASGGTDTGTEELPFESLFGMIFGALILAGPGLPAITKHLLNSYLILPPGSLDVLSFRTWGETLIQLIADHVVLAFILSGPVLVIVLLVEVSMQIVAAFTPQMQIYSIQFGFRSIAAIGALLLFLNFTEEEVFFLMESHSVALTTLMENVE